MKTFKQYKKNKNERPQSGDPTGQPGTGVCNDVTKGPIADETILELHGKGKIDDIGRHHGKMRDHAHTKRGSNAKEYHTLQRNRAGRIKGILTGRISGTFVKHNKEYNKQDREKAREVKSKIKSSDYLKDN
ncbi:MAG: hypothetical protein ACXV2C_08265 [Candidatus Bathyarchaeia archaeon]